MITRNSSGDEIPERDRVPKFVVGALYPPKTTNAARFYMLLAVADDAYTTSVLNAHFLAQKISEINRGVVKLMLGHCAPDFYTIYRVISAAFGFVLVYINLQPEYELHSLTRFEQFQKFGKN